MDESSSLASVARYDAPPRRRWMQFNLKALLAAVTVFAILLGWLGHERGWWRSRGSLLAAQAVLDAARSGYREAIANYEAGIMTPQQVCEWSQRWMEAESEIARTHDEKVTAAVAHIQRIDQLRHRTQLRHASAVAYHFAKARADLEQLQPNVNVDQSLELLRSLRGTWTVESINPRGVPSSSFAQPGEWTELEFAGDRIGFRAGGSYQWAFLTLDASTSPVTFKAGAMSTDYQVTCAGNMSLDGDKLTIEVTSEPKPIILNLKRQPPIPAGPTSGPVP